MNISLIVFIIFFIIWIIKFFLEAKSEALEISLGNALRVLADSSRLGEAIESIIERLSVAKNEPSAKIFKEILKEIEKGETFANGVIEVAKRKNSPILTYLSPILSTAQESGVDVYEIMNNYTSKLNKLKFHETYVRNTFRSNLLVLKVVAIVVLPAIFYFFPFIFEEATFDPFIFNFFALFAGIIGLIDLVLYDDFITSLVHVPLYSSFSLVLVSILQRGPEILEILKGFLV